MARKPQPAEIKRATGRTPGTDSGGRQLKPLAQVTQLPMATEPPPAPADLGDAGRALWDKAWARAITWLSPLSDLQAIEHACRLSDDLALARGRYRATLEPQDGRLVVALSKSLSDALSALGFDPTSRSRLGVEVTRNESAIDKLKAKRASSN